MPYRPAEAPAGDATDAQLGGNKTETGGATTGDKTDAQLGGVNKNFPLTSGERSTAHKKIDFAINTPVLIRFYHLNML